MPDLDLEATQELMWRALVWPEGVRDFLDHCAPEDRAAFDAVFAGSEHFTAQERVEVYAQGYFWRLHDVLADEVPVLRALLGHTEFHNLATDYVRERPSRAPDLHRFGAGFAEFVAGHSISARVPCAADLARFERAQYDVLVAEDAAPATPEDLGDLSPEDLAVTHFVPVPALATIATCWNLTALVHAHRDERPLESPTSPSATPQMLVVWRQALDVFHRPLSSEEAQAWAVMAEGGSFTAICEFAAGRGWAPQWVVGWLQSWIRDGMLQVRPALSDS